MGDIRPDFPADLVRLAFFFKVSLDCSVDFVSYWIYTCKSLMLSPIFKRLYVLYTVNVVIFAGGKFRENVGKTFHVGVIFTIFHLFP